MASESDANVDQAADSLSKIFLDETDCDLLVRSSDRKILSFCIIFFNKFDEYNALFLQL